MLALAKDQTDTFYVEGERGAHEMSYQVHLSNMVIAETDDIYCSLFNDHRQVLIMADIEEQLLDDNK